MKKGEHKGRVTGRGFRDYACIVDNRGTQITVRESSSADGHCVWIFCKNADGSDAQIGFPWRPWKPGETGEHLVTAGPHMGRREAKLLIEALQRFLDDGQETRRG